MKNCFIIVFFIFSIPLFAQTETETDKPWLPQLRRAEIIAFGSFPFTLFTSIFLIDTVRFFDNGFDTRYAPWPFKAASAFPMTENEKNITLTVAIVGSVVIAVVDYFLFRTKQRRQIQPETPRIIRTPQQQ
ncbi:MAG: hypothetical protein LBQ77_06535 [Treponema sp.]|jgi:hypothetical protein|nr:hypothetical protein [Treponema sp.]